MEERNTSQSVVEYILQLNNRLKRCQDIAITRMKECQLKRKTWYDRDAVERKFVEGDLVLVLATSKQNKLEVNWIGPGKVLSRISDTNYVIDVLGRRDRSTIYHVNLLKPYHRRPELVSLVVEEVSDDIVGDAEIPYPDKQCTKFDYHVILWESQLQLKLSPSQIDELKQVITKNKDVFSPDPGTTHLMRMDIELISKKPIKTKPYRMSPRQINILREEIKRLLELGVIEIGQSDYTSPLILVKSPNKDPRPCVVYRRLNEITRSEFFPLPNMEEIVEKVSAAPYVTVMPLSKGYFQIPLTPRAQRYAAFVTPFGTYIPKKRMFGLVCAPYYFCKLMALVLEGLEQFALPYIDDIAIFSQGWKDYVKHIDIVLGRLRKAGLKVKLSKLGYYSHYIPNYSTISSPLTDALKGKIKKEKITWDEKCGKAFEELKAKLVSQPILFAPDFATDFILQTDASEDNTIAGQYYCRTILCRTILDRDLGARAAGVHYRLFSVWTLVPVRRDQQLSDHSTVDEIASGAADCRLTYTMANCPQRRLENRERGKKENEKKKEKELEKDKGWWFLGSGEENPRVLFGDADQESETRMSKNALRTGRRQAVESATSKRGHHTG
ncbi:retrovirus-related Pol polyprotein from transposon 297 [Trichonephila clavipes]|nr:retrovirus-related Pol polyprotein from transposon 297 [Trichonephila clavipes]